MNPTPSSRPRLRIVPDGAEPDRAGHGAAPAAPGWRASLGFATAVFCVSRAILALIAAYSFSIEGQPVHWLRMLYQWDANFYLSIAAHGYALPQAITGDETGQSNLNFLPLLPLATFLIAKLVGSTAVAGLVFSNISLLAATIMLHRLVAIRHGDTAARWAALSLMSVPGSFALSGMMTEAPFLALSITAAYAAARDRPALAALGGSLLTITRLTGCAQALGFALEWLIARLRARPASYRRLFLICLTPLPLFGYFGFMFVTTGDAFAAIHSNATFWDQQLGAPFKNFAMILWTTQPRLRVQWAIGCALLAVLLSQYRSFGPGEWLFLILSIETASSAAALSPSLIRYMIGLYPVHIAMGQLCAKHWGGRVLLIVFACIDGALVGGWVHGAPTYI